MSHEILQNVLVEILTPYLGFDDSVIDYLLANPSHFIKERIKKIEHLEVWIYSNDHDPPHFHVKSNDYKINAKFLIENGEYLGGEIGSKDLKKIRAFYNSPKTKVIMDIIWKKKFQ